MKEGSANGDILHASRSSRARHRVRGDNVGTSGLGRQRWRDRSGQLHGDRCVCWPWLLQLLGWIQLVRSPDNAFHRHQFEMNPFDPFGLYQHAPSPYCWYGIAPTLFDAPTRDERKRLDWVAHSFLAASPLRDNRRSVTPLLGFAWGFHIAHDGSVALASVTSLTAADWESHLPYLRSCYTAWQFTELLIPSYPSGV
jgi:hypothetical protein